MNLEPIQVEDALEKLRAMGAVGEVQGASRVARFRHYLYEWLGVNKLESAVMIELILRGAQTVGELRGRAARMEPIADLAALRPILTDLIDRGLVISLSPEGRGQTVTHALYLDQEMDKVRRDVDSQPATSPTPPRASTSSAQPAPTDGASSNSNGDIAELKAEVRALGEQVAKLKSEIEDIWTNIG
jgi:uncharacterized protein YceH (UPF0502 family)